MAQKTHDTAALDPRAQHSDSPFTHPSTAKVTVCEGTHSASYAVKAARVKVISAYPITPQTSVVEKLSELCASGELDADFIKVESEHSAMACVIGSEAAGSRSFTATSSQGLALMHEMLHWAGGARLPIVMVNVNRALGTPWNIHCDHNDSLSQRDTGWMQVFVESNQEVYDTILQAYLVAEQVSMPCMVNMDAFFLSHTTEPVAIPRQELVDRYLPPLNLKYTLNPDEPHAFGGLAMPDKYMELRYKMHAAMESSKEKWAEADRLFGEIFGRSYGGMVEHYRTDDAELLLIISSTAASTARITIDAMRDEGIKVGMLKLRVFRPFPAEAFREALAGRTKAVVLDRNISFGMGGIFAQEVRAAVKETAGMPPIFGCIAGLGGRDITPDTIREAFSVALMNDKPTQDIYWIGLKPHVDAMSTVEHQ
jgi:pyruvate/2-oxoacid:ferredoxin oxidoreductase alpha subunit